MGHQRLFLWARIRMRLIIWLAGDMQVIINLSTGNEPVYVKEGHHFLCAKCSYISVVPETAELGDSLRRAWKLGRNNRIRSYRVVDEE